MKKREDFCLNVPINNRSFYFMPIDFIYRNNYGVSYLDIIGINSGGHKTLVRVTNLPIFVDMILTDETVKLIANNDYTIIKQLPGKGFSEPLDYARIYFKSIKDRVTFINNVYGLSGKYLHGNAKYGDKIIKYTGFLLGNDDNYKFLFTRYMDINTCNWNIISGYERIMSEPKFKYQVLVELNLDSKKKQIEKCEEIPENLKKDRTIICAWDLETYTDYKYGRVPDPNIQGDKIKMCSMVFKYYWSKEILHQVLITSIPIKLDLPNLEIIYTENIPLEFANVLSRMMPDLITGYNDGNYDWPFIKNRIDCVKMLDIVSPIKLSDFEKKLYGSMKENENPRIKIIKIDAENSARYNGFLIPGAICFDTSIVMRRINKTETKWRSLNNFLQKYGIELKYDMPYEKMDKIFHLWELTTPEEMQNLINDKVDVKNYYPFSNDAKVGRNSINNLNPYDILELFKDSNNVGVYCLRDAEACLDLLHKISIVSDTREMGNIAFTTMMDGFYNADGIKVRNCLYYFSMKPEWGSWEEKYTLSFSGNVVYVKKEYKKKKEEKKKYPGGHVIFPDKGIYGKVQIVNNKVISDRPCSGLDFSSLYPSLIMAYNFSPEYYFTPSHYLLGNYETLHISTHYKLNSEEKTEETVVVGYFMRQKSIFENNTWRYENHGIFPTVLRRLFNKRKLIKQDMNTWAVILEKIDCDIKPYISKENILLKNCNIELIKTIIDTKIKVIEERSVNYTGHKKKLELDKIKNYEYAYKLISEKLEQFKCLEILYENAQFNYNYYNTKQNAIKVFMNTFYGEMGSVDSPFFIIPMSGGVTKMGRRALKRVKKFVIKKGYKVYYGDTDSVYISPPEDCFSEIDNKYLNGEITKENFYEEMVGITMVKMKEISSEVAAYLLKKIGNPFLNMEYEEVLFPFGFFGKKNYFGVKHINSIDFSLCKNPDSNVFLKQIFVRGLPLRRRDGSKFVKEILNEILIKFCSLYETNSYEEIVYNTIESYINMTIMEPSKYTEKIKKNYSFREPRENSHTAQMRFRERMLNYYKREQINRAYYQIKNGDLSGYETLKLFDTVYDSNYVIDDNLLNLNFNYPNYGDREDLVLVIRPDILNDRGGKTQKRRGDYLEYPKMLGNKYYAQLIKSDYEKNNIIVNITNINIDFSVYFNELYGKVARFLLYLNRYSTMINDKYIEKGSTKQALKDAEKYVIANVKKDLNNKYKNHFSSIICDSSKLKLKFKEQDVPYKQIVGTGKIATLFKKYMTESDFTNEKLTNETIKLFIPVMVNNVIKLPSSEINKLNGDSRLIHVKKIELLKKELLTKINNICIGIDKILYPHVAIKDCEEKLKHIRKLITIEDMIFNIKEKSNFTINLDEELDNFIIDNKFNNLMEDFLNN